jgi:ABC-type uncharacterized transport system ATPase subunit
MAAKFQAPRVFGQLSVVDNLRLAARGVTPVRRLLLSRQPPDLRDRVDAMLAKLRLADYATARASALSHGHQQWLEIAMVLINGPRIVLLDEPTAGMSPQERAETADILAELGTDVSVLLIEHDLDFVRGVCDVVTVLDQGRVLAAGPPDGVAADKDVRAAYTARLASEVS